MDLELSLDSGRSDAALRGAGRLTAGESQMRLRTMLDALLDGAVAAVVLDLSGLS